MLMPLIQFDYDFKIIHCYASMVSISNNFRLLFQKFICFCNNCKKFRFVLTFNRIMQIRSKLIKWSLMGNRIKKRERKRISIWLKWISSSFFMFFSSLLEIFIAQFSIRFNWTSSKCLTVWRSLWKSSKKIAKLNVSKMYNVRITVRQNHF